MAHNHESESKISGSNVKGAINLVNLLRKRGALNTMDNDKMLILNSEAEITLLSRVLLPVLILMNKRSHQLHS